jgi:hypothetical protein
MYSALLRVNSDLILVDKECSSTGSQIDVYASKDGRSAGKFPLREAACDKGRLAPKLFAPQSLPLQPQQLGRGRRFGK